jgi:hypothetical protein
MATQNLSLSIPEALYDQIKERAALGKRTIEAETLDLLAQAVPIAVTMPDDLVAVIAPLALLDDDTLLRAARSHLATDAAAALESLHLKQQREELTATEMETRNALVRQYERAMVIRAQAAALLHERGIDVGDIPTS